MKLRNLLVLALGVAFVLPFAAHAQTQSTITFDVDGVGREAIVFVPDKPPASGKVPVVFGFHWGGGTMEQDVNVFAFQKYWPEAIVVYMQGLPSGSNGTGGLGWQHQMGENGDRDLKFLDAVLASLHQKFPIDDHRIYASGFSNGSQFSYFLWSARPKLFAAYAIVAGRIQNDNVKLTEPRPAYLVVGTKDPGYAQMKKVMDMVRELDGTTASEGTPCGTLQGVTGVGCTTYASTKGAPVTTYVHDFGHTYPLPISPKFVEFFKAHALPD